MPRGNWQLSGTRAARNPSRQLLSLCSNKRGILICYIAGQNGAHTQITHVVTIK
jgi:hypothetical protein